MQNAAPNEQSVKAIQRLERMAGSAPWRAPVRVGAMGNEWAAYDCGGEIVASFFGSLGRQNAEFVVAARNSLPKIIDTAMNSAAAGLEARAEEVASLKAELKTLKLVLDHYRSTGDKLF